MPTLSQTSKETAQSRRVKLSRHLTKKSSCQNLMTTGAETAAVSKTTTTKMMMKKKELCI